MLSILDMDTLRQRKITTGGSMWKEFSPDGNIYRLLHGPTGLRRLPLDAQPTEASTGSEVNARLQPKKVNHRAMMHV